MVYRGRMKKRLVQLDLPAFAFVEGSWHEEGGDPLKCRTVILHVRSASVIEVLPRESFLGGEPNVLRYNFTYFNERTFVGEDYVMLLHYSTTLDKDVDRQMIIDNVMKPASKWFCDYCDWEDMMMPIVDF